MTAPDKRKPGAAPAPKDGDKSRKGEDYDKEVEGTFPASDPPADSEPGGGITGPTPTRDRGEQR